MKYITFFIIAIFLPGLIHAETVFESINQDYNNKQIDYETYLVNSVLAIYAPELLPPKYHHLMGVQPQKCGTPILMQVKTHWDSLSAQAQSKIQGYLFRPKLQAEYLSESKLFIVHYDTSGSHAVADQDEDSDGIPDFVEAAATALDRSYRLIVDTLGYNPPPTDRDVDGAEYDLYFRRMGVYGQTQPEIELSKSPSTYTSYIEINNEFGPGFATHGTDAVKVTCAHEFFHTVQLGYAYRNEDVFFFEISSTWMEDVAYDYVNDYYAYLRYHFDNPNRPFNEFNGEHEYALCIWNHMLAEKYGNDVIHSIWEFIVRHSALEAMDYALIDYGKRTNRDIRFEQELESFAIWNYFTQDRAKPATYYSEGVHYPKIRPRKSYSFETDVSFTDSIQEFSTGYYEFSDPDNNRNFVLILQHLKPPESNRIETSKFHINVLSNPLGQNDIRLDDALYVQFQSSDKDVVQGNGVILYDNGEVKVKSFNTTATPEIPPLRLFPNPFILGDGSDFKIQFELENREWVEISILTMNGNLVKKIQIEGILPGYFNSGFHPEGEWDGTNAQGQYVSSGIYIVCLKTESCVKLEKISVIRK